MKKFALIGERLGHSYSPEIHRSILKKLGRDGEYSLLEIGSEEIPSVIEEIKSKELSGINVTIPYKVEVMKYLDEITPEAEGIGAVNTVTLKNGRVVGHNTDYWGFRYTVERMKIDLKDQICVALGGGGSARAVIKVLQDLGGIVYLVSRSPEKLREAFGNFTDLNIISYDGLKNLQGELIVNTTPVGMHPNTDACVVEEKIIKSFAHAIDLIYNPRETLFLSMANSGENGLYMLVGQAVKAEEIWWDEGLESFEDIYHETETLVYR